MSLYVVKSGDNLSLIAEHVLGNVALWPEIARLNNIPGPNYVITVGETLHLPDASSPAPVPASSAAAPATTGTTAAASSSPGMFSRVAGWVKANPKRAALIGGAVLLAGGALFLQHRRAHR